MTTVAENTETAPAAAKLPERLNGETLRSWRERMGYSQRDACEQVGCSRGAWAGWEAGEHPVPRYIGLALAALALGMVPYGALDKPVAA